MNYWFQIRAEAAYLYDAVLLYARALREVLMEGGDPYDGVAIMKHIRGRRYVSAMGYCSLFFIYLVVSVKRAYYLHN